MLTARLTARPAGLAAALALVPVLLVGGAGAATALPELSASSPSTSLAPTPPAPVVTSPLPIGEVSRSPTPEPTPPSTEADDERVADTSAPADPVVRLVQLALGAGLLLGVAGGVGLYLTRKSRGAHR